MSSRDWVPVAVLGLVLLALALVAPLGFSPNWELVEGYAQWIMAVGALATTVVSGAALIGVVRTYQQTKRSADLASAANDLNRQTLFSTTRPYIEIRNVTLTEHFGPEGQYNWSVAAHIANASNFPAIDVAVDASVRPRPLVTLGSRLVANFAVMFATNTSPHIGGVVVRPGTEAKLWHLGEEDLPIQSQIPGYLITVAVRYRSNVNPEHYYVAGNYTVDFTAIIYRDDTSPFEDHVRTGAIVSESQVAT